MSVFKAIKGTLLNVQQDISLGIKSLTTNDPNSPGSPVHPQHASPPTTPSPHHPSVNLDAGAELLHRIKSLTTNDPNSPGSPVHPQHASPPTTPSPHHPSVNLDAGAELLHRFQVNWKEIHQASEESAKKAQVVDSETRQMAVVVERQNDALNEFLSETNHLPNLATDVQVIMEKIADLQVRFMEIEHALVELEDTCDKQEVNTNHLHHEYQLAGYRRRKHVELEELKGQLAKTHARKVGHHETQMQKNLKVKQQEFETAFKQEMQYYKLYGHPSPKASTVSSPEKEMIDLGDIAVADDLDVLDEFLEIDVPCSPSNEHSAVAAECDPPTAPENTPILNDPDSIPAPLAVSDPRPQTSVDPSSDPEDAEEIDNADPVYVKQDEDFNPEDVK